MNLRMKIFEGPDCCGKSTQADLLMSELDDCMLIHFPLLKTTKQSVDMAEFFKKDPSSNVSLAIKNLNETLYSDEYIKSDIPISDKNSTITNNMKNNIVSNGTNKFLFVTYLNEYINPEYTEEDLRNSYKYLDFDSIILRLRLHGKDITEDKFEALMTYRKEMIFNPEFKEKLFTIVLDRFFVSGRFYNLEMPLAIYRKKMANVFSTKNEFDYYYFLEKTLRDIYDTGEKELLRNLQSSLIKYNYNHSDSFDEQKKSLSLLSVLEIFKYANVLPFVHSYIFMPSECIRKKVLEGSRNTDAYDKNKDMQFEISLLYTSLREYFLPANDENKRYVNDCHTNDNMIYYASAMPNIDNLLTVSKKDSKFVIREVHDAVMRNADFINYGRYIQAYDRRSSNMLLSTPLFNL